MYPVLVFTAVITLLIVKDHSHTIVNYQVASCVSMNPTDQCDDDTSFFTKDYNDYQLVISKYATGSMDMDMDMVVNTDMNKNTADDLNSIEQTFSLPEPILQPLDSQERDSESFQEIGMYNGETVVQPPCDSPINSFAQNGTMDNLYQGFNTNSYFCSESKRLKCDDMPLRPTITQDVSIHPSSNRMNNTSSLDSCGSSPSCDGFISGCPAVLFDGYPLLNTDEGSSSACGNVPEGSVDDSSIDIYIEEQEEAFVANDEEEENDDSGRTIRHWTEKEIKLLEEGVKLYGTNNNWKKIATHVGDRNASQCVNKWKNRRSEGWKKWNKAASEVLKGLIKQGLSFKEIQVRMSDYTYIQIYQHHQKLAMNSEPWEKWEVELLIKLKKEGKLSDTQIGKKLNNRHKDSVKCKWNEINKK